MNIKFALTCLLAGSLLAPMTMTVAYADGDVHPVDFVKDSTITTKIKTKLAAEHLKSLKNIQVDTDHDGVVWLSGHASSQYQIDKAVSLAHSTDGVRDVKNNITLMDD